MSSETADGDLRKRLHALDTCAVSDALDHLHLSGATTGVRPMHSGCGKIAGYAHLDPTDPVEGPSGDARWRRCGD